MEFVLVLFIFGYVTLIVSFIIGFDKYESIPLKENKPLSKFSILIPFRNEAKNLPDLLQSLEGIDYPITHFEVILIDDFSRDNFKELIEVFKRKNPEFNLNLLKNQHSTSPKKTAISLGIKNAVHPFIITTDADCIVPVNWLKSLDYFITKKNSNMICAPVSIVPKKSPVNYFERLNFNSLQGSTIGSFGTGVPFLCNGANLCYSKEIFLQVNGFIGNDKIASGDDIFLLEKFLKYDKQKVHFLKSKEAIVQTKGQENFSDFLQQQIRWAKKSSAYTNKNAQLIGALVFLTNLILIVSFGLVLFNHFNLLFFISGVALKFLADFILLHKTNAFLNQKQLNFYTIPSSLVYPMFMMLIFMLSITKKFQWKNRNFER